MGLLPNLTLILFVVGLNGLLGPAVNLSHFNILLKVMPADQRPVYTAMYTTIVNLGAFICPLIGVLVAERIGISTALIVFGALSIVGSIFLLVAAGEGVDVRPNPPAPFPEGKGETKISEFCGAFSTAKHRFLLLPSL